MPRPIWQGSISFGLVNIPIQLQTAVHEKSVHFHLMSKDGSCRLRRKLYCPDTGKEVEYGDTARGIEIGKDEYVLVDEKELAKIKPEKGRTLVIEQFVKLEEIDPIYFDRAYFVTPASGNERAYKLFVEAMKASGRLGIGRFVMHGRQNLAAVRVMGDGLVLHTMHYSDEVSALEDALPGTLGRAKTTDKEIKVANQLIESMTQPLELSEYKDDYREQVETLIAKKKQGKTFTAPHEPEEPHLAGPINLMDALRRSLAANKAPRNGRRYPHRKSA